MYHYIFVEKMIVVEVQAKMESEKEGRRRAEARLLDVEKKKTELSVDLSQFQQQVSSLRQELKAEIDKVSVHTLKCITYY